MRETMISLVSSCELAYNNEIKKTKLLETLFLAIYNDNLKELEQSIAAASTDQLNEYFTPPLPPELLKKIQNPKEKEEDLKTPQYPPLSGANTILGYAAFFHRMDAVKCLLDHGADPNALPPLKLSQFLSPYEDAIHYCKVELVEFFLNNGFQPSPIAYLQFCIGNSETYKIVELLFDKGEMAIFPFSQTLLYRACAFNFISYPVKDLSNLVKVLLSHGITLTAKQLEEWKNKRTTLCLDYVKEYDKMRPQYRKEVENRIIQIANIMTLYSKSIKKA